MAASELAKSKTKGARRAHLTGAALAKSILLGLSLGASVLAVPAAVGAQTPAGDALPVYDSYKAANNAVADISINEKVMNIVGKSQNVVLKWDDFTIGKDATVDFKEARNYLNLVNGPVSVIHGVLKGAGGNIYLINPNGIIFGETSKVTVTGGNLYASTRNIDEAAINAFKANGTDPLATPAGSLTGDIVNLGEMTASAVTLEGDNICFINGKGTVDSGMLTANVRSEIQVGVEKDADMNKDLLSGAAKKWADTGDITFYKLVKNVTELQAIRDDHPSGNINITGKYMLANDIDASATEKDPVTWGLDGFDPIGMFVGKFNGMGYEIKNLYINRPTADKIGLFGEIGVSYKSNKIEGSAVIKNVSLKDSSITGNSYVGGIVGKATGFMLDDVYYNVEIANVGLTGGSVTGNSSQVGGIVGALKIASITGCYNNSGSVTGNSSHVGGIVGELNTASLTGCYNNGGSVTGPYNVGGLVGYAYDSSIENSSNTGSVTATAEVIGQSGGAGGIVGNFTQSTIDGCNIKNVCNTGAVTAEKMVQSGASSAYGTGGIAGVVVAKGADVNITGAHNEGAITGANIVGGLVGKAVGEGNKVIIKEGCNTAQVTGIHGIIEGTGIGGIVGRGTDCNIEKSYNTGTITMKGDSVSDANGKVGGLIGQSIAISAPNTISGYNTGEIYIEGKMKDIGGLVGGMWDVDSKIEYNTTTVVGYNTGNIILSSGAAKNFVGGLVGRSQKSYITGYNTGNIINVGDMEIDGAGGLVGQSEYDNSITGFNTGNIAGSRRLGGLVGYLDGTGILTGYNTGKGIISRSDFQQVTSSGGLVGECNSSATVKGQDASGGGYLNPIGIGQYQTASVIWNDNIAADGSTFKKLTTTDAGGNSVDIYGFDRLNWGADISAVGGATTTWRVYEDNTLPLLRSFLKPINTTDLGVSATTLEYNGKEFSERSGLPEHIFLQGGGKNVGEYNLYSDQTGYDLIGENITMKITPKTLTIGDGTAKVTKVYDGNTAAGKNLLTAGNYTLTGIIDGDEVTLAATADSTFGASNAGETTVTYNVGLSGAAAGNYQISSSSKEFGAIITPKKLGLEDHSPVKIGRTYNGNNTAEMDLLKPEHYTLTGIVGTDEVGLNVTASGTFDSKDAGYRTVTYSSFELTGADKGNYEAPDSMTLEASIQKAPLGIDTTATPITRRYDGTNTAGTDLLTAENYTLTGIVGSEAVSLVASAPGTFASGNAGNTTVTYTVGLSGADAGNYTIRNEKKEFNATITPRELTVSQNSGAPAVTRAYDGSAVAGKELFTAEQYTLSGDIVSGETVKLVATADGVFNSKNVDEATSVTYTVGLNTANYKITSGLDADNKWTAGGKITPAQLTLTGYKGGSLTYDGTEHTITGYTYNEADLAAGDTISFTNNTFTVRDVGTYGMIPNYTINDGNGGNNYEVTGFDNSTLGRLTITPRALVLTATAASSVIGEDIAPVSGTANWGAGDGTETDAITWRTDANKDIAGKYEITGIFNENYLTAYSTNYIIDLAKINAAANATAYEVTAKSAPPKPVPPPDPVPPKPEPPEKGRPESGTLLRDDMLSDSQRLLLFQNDSEEKKRKKLTEEETAEVSPEIELLENKGLANGDQLAEMYDGGSRQEER